MVASFSLVLIARRVARRRRGVLLVSDFPSIGLGDKKADALIGAAVVIDEHVGAHDARTLASRRSQSSARIFASSPIISAWLTASSSSSMDRLGVLV
jgi:hypothetical protein